MTERDMQSLFGKYVKAHMPEETEAYELKYTSGTSIPFNAVQEHQVDALTKAECGWPDVKGMGGLYHRITDQPWIADRPYSYTLKKPFDCFVLVNVKAYVVVWFYKQRQPKEFIKIRIGAFLQLRDKSNRKSFTEEMARSVAKEIIRL